MVKGMSLEELRANLEGDAQKTVKEQAEKIIKLEKEINKLRSYEDVLKQDISEKDRINYCLFNRCRALSGGSLCTHCNLFGHCLLTINKYGKIYSIENLEIKLKKDLLHYCNEVTSSYEKEHPEFFKQEKENNS